MHPLVELSETPHAEEMYMLAGWRHWADAGSTSSELPPYLIEHLSARPIGRVRNDGFYMFQIPGMHHYLRPEIKLEDGYRQELRYQRNEVYYTKVGRKGLVIFLGDEPHLNADSYAEAFFDVAQALGVKRIIAFGGVYGPVPFDKERQISCAYSLKRLKDELSRYAVRFSNYEGGVSLGSFLTDRAEKVGMEYISMYAFVPMYDLSQLSPRLQGISIEQDYKAWYDIMRRVDHMLGLGLDLSDLARQSDLVTETMSQKLDELEDKVPQLNIREHLDKLAEDFVETPFMPLDDIWSRELDDLFKDLDV
jgi:proteasome assembly chaperone (PAC2) family protein